MIPVLTIPHLNRPDLLRRCVKSVDYPVRDFVVIQNGPDKDCEIEYILGLMQGVPHERFHHIRGPNLGCSASWNYSMIAFPGAPYWMFVGNDVEFHPGTLAKMDTAAQQHHLTHAALFGNLGHSMFIQTRRGTQHVGLFDWQIHPAYCEDCEWMWRLNCAGERYIDVEGATATHGTPDMPGSCTIHSDPRMRSECHRTHGNNNTYYERKWGGPPGKEVYRSPFNNGGSVTTIDYDPEIRAKNVWNL